PAGRVRRDARQSRRYALSPRAAIRQPRNPRRMSELVLLNGEIVDSADARLSVFDAGITHGAGLFETVRVYNANPFRLDEHIKRMRLPAARLPIAIPWADAEWPRAASRVLQANELREARMRITVPPGDPRAGGADERPPATLLITAQKFEAYAA